MQSYQIHLKQFEGPFDLLLFFIERDELDIYDIPISKITQDFLDYLHHLEEWEIETASEFIYMAATLIKIKTRTLLPKNTEGQDAPAEDPRQELVQQLVAYKQFKAIQKEWEALEERAHQLFPSGKLTAVASPKPEDYLHSVTLYQLLMAYKKALEQQELREKKPTYPIQQYPYTPEEVKSFLQSLLFQHEKIDFLSLVAQKPDKLFIIFSILCILEMVQYQEVKIIIGEGFNNFWLVKLEKDPTLVVATETL